MSLSWTRPMKLERRQWQVARLVADGLQNREIAATVGISRHCVKNDIHRILDETGMNTRLELALWYVAVGESLLAASCPLKRF